MKFLLHYDSFNKELKNHQFLVCMNQDKFRGRKMQCPETTLALQQTMSNSQHVSFQIPYLGPPPSHRVEVELGY